MSVELNHIIIPAKDKRASADFLAGLLGVEAGPQWGPFIPVHVANGVTLDYQDYSEAFLSHHCAFLVRKPGSPTTPTPPASDRVRSIISTEAAACTSRTRTATSWR